MPVANAPLALKVLTVNAHKGFTFFNRKFILPELRDAVRAVAPDLVFLQEVLGAHASHATRFKGWPETSQYEFLADSIWNDFAYGRNAVYPHGHHGNAVLSKFPIVHYENMDVSVGKHEKRGLLHCVIQPPDRESRLHAICVHLGLQEGHRQQQLDLLCDRIDHTIPGEEPVVIAGDFNDWRLRAHGKLSRCAGLKEVFVVTQGVAARTFPARWPLLRLDRIYVRNMARFRPLALATRPWTHLSDHAPLAAEVVL
jgi:endonuclease/exonuclease/phosphatase family metal-dependent hydrolase